MASEHSHKKRKRDGDSAVKPKKKVALDVPPQTTTVSSVLQSKSCPPVIAMTPGISVPRGTAFDCYAARESSKLKLKSAKQRNSEILLHTSAHRSLDLIAREEVPRGNTALLNHYVGIYDPKTGKLEVVEAKKMVVRGQVRSKQASDEAMGEKAEKKTMMDLRTDLGQTFGTKKAKKALNERVLNAISPEKKRAADEPIKLDNAALAVMNGVGEVASKMATREELQAITDAAKPVPPANREADDIADVYDPKKLVGYDVFDLIPIREWQEKVRHGEGVQVASAYVANRINALASNESAVTRLRVLRYLYFAILIHKTARKGREPNTKALAPPDKLREILVGAPEPVVENLRRKFSERGVMRKFHLDLLRTYCCAMACIVDNFEVDTQNLVQDLGLDQPSLNQYFREIGARVKPVSNAGRKTHVARLALPLEFPKQRVITQKKR